MKKTVLLIFLINCTIGISQTEYPFYEQLAFDFFQKKLIDSVPIKKRIKVYPYVMDFHPSRNGFYNPNCLGIAWNGNDQLEELESYVETQLQIDSERFELNFSNLEKRRFKIKKRGKGTYPRLKITPPFKNLDGSEGIFVNIHITKEYLYYTFHFEFNDNGEIINWCKTYNEVIRTF